MKFFTPTHAPGAPVERQRRVRAMLAVYAVEMRTVTYALRAAMGFRGKHWMLTGGEYLPIRAALLAHPAVALPRSCVYEPFCPAKGMR